ncbi:porin family protein [Aquimarina mytili]|uniref:PorT family protein n=1 Tax=Aquimarina mytili TaxID=874423 RepID=A0A936ZVZ2_9FLAO|nr:porin family protein [Aquimarina mytili]MBL0682995.1 PorT family protein [Aquimarina mytili]
MNKNIFIIVIVLFSSINFLLAQDEDPLYTRAGFKFGGNYANITGDLENTDARVRMHLGAVIEFPITSNFFVQAEVLYSAQGYTIEENSIENEISLNYLALPLIAKYYFVPKFSFETGPRFATLANESNSIGDETDEFFNTYNDFDFGWVFGAGFKAESGLFFQVHYTLGLNNVFNTDINDISSNHSIAQLSVGYLFKTKNNRRQQSQE